MSMIKACLIGLVDLDEPLWWAGLMGRKYDTHMLPDHYGILRKACEELGIDHWASSDVYITPQWASCRQIAPVLKFVQEHTDESDRRQWTLAQYRGVCRTVKRQGMSNVKDIYGVHSGGWVAVIANGMYIGVEKDGESHT
jgi:hypothetical protein